MDVIRTLLFLCYVEQDELAQGKILTKTGGGNQCGRGKSTDKGGNKVSK